MSHKEEQKRILKVYADRKAQEKSKSALESEFIRHVVLERERVYARILSSAFSSFENLRILEIGAGEGANIPFFIRSGIPVSGIFANELIPERSSVLAKRFPEITVLPGDAFEIEKGDGFDVVFQGTVFSSILDPKLRQSLAEKMKSLLRPGGIILWYDFTFDNPKNKNVTGIRKKEILENYGPWSKAEFYRVTLAPPLGRRIGPLYPLVNALFPFLRTHIAGCLKP